MRLVTFVHGGAAPRVGVLHRDRVLDPHAAQVADAAITGQEPSAPVPTEMIGFLESGDLGRRAADRAIELYDAYTERGDDLNRPGEPVAVLAVDAVRLLAPIPRPRRLRDYLTYNQHAAGSGLSVPPAFEAMPICYQGNVESVVGPGDPLLWPSYSEQLDFELELGFYTKGGGRDLTPEEAAKRIAGVTILNDVSARDIQVFEMSLTIGISKGKHFCSAMGPCLLTMDEVDEWSIAMSARVNGETWASGTTKDRQFSFAEVLAWASLDEDVYPGEFFGLGTVGGGCGLELDRWIQPGDLVELEAAGIGVLANRVAEPSPRRPGSGVASYSGAPRVRVQAAP
jgi:2-keto-4-pentenoate hydratase/2-oxohepta-3-ene-1,7-dioic acid hydratase in catechol pathway